MMENINHVSQTTGNLQELLAIQRSILTSLDNLPLVNNTIEEIPHGPIFGVPDVQNNYEYCQMLFEMSPQNQDSQEQTSLPKIDLQMIDDVIGQACVEMQMETSTSQGTEYLDSSPHLYDTPNLGFAQLYEVPPPVPSVQNPLVMISGVKPQPTTINYQPQLQEASSPQAMSVASSSENVFEGVPQSPPEIGEVKSAGEGQMMQASKIVEVPNLPDYKELLIRIRYRSQEVIREHVTNPYGCLVYFKNPLNFENIGPRKVELPDITSEQRSAMTECQFKFTDQVLKASEKGLFLRCDEEGNIYATRFCQCKIFWWSTEKGPVVDGGMSNYILQKLERNREVMVFDNVLFRQMLFHYIVNKPTFQKEQASVPHIEHSKPCIPAVFFTFAQPWNPTNSALSSCLVSMVVNPVRARIEREWGNDGKHESYDVSDYKLQLSKSL